MTGVEPEPPPTLVPRIVRKALVTVLVGGVSYLVSNALIHGPNENPWSLLLATFISGVAFVVQFLVDVDDQLQTVRKEQSRQHSKTHTLVADSFTRINEASKLFGLMEMSSLHTRGVAELVRNATKIRDDMPDLVKSLVHHEISRMAKFLGELTDGRYALYEGEDRDWLLALAKNTQVSLDAISLTSVDARDTEFAGGFWHTDLGQRYVKLQRDLVQRGVRVRRVFVMDRSERLDSDAFRRVWKWQAGVGIEVRTLLLTDAPPLLRGSLSDFILFDGVVYYESNPAPQLGDDIAPVIHSTILVRDQERVRERVERFSELWQAATPAA
ncbi:phosphatidylserine/phosphatidylglycerophosphate/cardiolipin synthase family protein [Microbispora triticiradicis]|uniref:Phosphatidylserine/phosphatidylglycerophosphate/ cardiolipin synthase family protein n=3 Tax=Microbispora TaxID=2005 RepID=A0ABY3LZL7_9ACTN|nr:MULTISPECIES: phosphatidylserine/phosphatidylglycerophosphate/cardiolipin synthase family protein [Microbispora]RGA02305.1 phosphatidylserine/phosphatidylglycerophosphate/cardiolipin synthase family protein [Microbispora triticiradicis]TLP52325.1 phosphatidylserine/phosphatidylglycerophosphate/cardiolipin synthase family protein [Microbispora fusca]TYB60423.1 phosphatidylserine/phosphatidylglycerophosphate/cardiolipin synthase family protein [Microbispora tritici]